MNKIKKFLTSVFGIKVTLSVVLAIVALLVAKIDLSATFIIAAFVVGIWIDEVLSAIIKPKGE